jgi:hypothetical protein
LQFTTEPKREHAAAVHWIGSYLKETQDKGVIVVPDISRIGYAPDFRLHGKVTMAVGEGEYRPKRILEVDFIADLTLHFWLASDL